MRLESIFIRKRKHLFSKPVPPLLGRPGSRRCPVSFLQYYRCSGSSALFLRAPGLPGENPWGAGRGASPTLVSLTHSLSLALRGRAGQCDPRSSIWKTPAGPGAAAGSHRAHPAIPGPQLSGVTGSFCACSPRSAATVSDFILLSSQFSPLLLLFISHC